MNHLYEQLTELKLTGFRDALKNQIAQPGADPVPEGGVCPPFTEGA